ncbi:tRNA dihydrouridine synthase DusB [Candidatus Woesearchaeota archaeon CG10_big_fil_rev_8_21_14_0_10_30_7]|nr:MAG: tRNA dihydrouridine synthase DusB [Candidatus Woesearchaeota archaeon CG10_big_fil_rev_8_21_14_0_10_30_7]
MKFPKLTSPAVLSPMSGVTDVAFRTLAKKYGAGMTYTEFVSSVAITNGSERTLRMIKTSKIEKPVAIQLYGNNVEEVIEAAKIVEDKFDVIDINCGCPVWKVIKTGAGSAMLNNPELIGKFVNKLASAIKKPVTVKIRIGIDKKNINAVKIAKIIEENGGAAIAIHGRTQKQGYRDTADWTVIKEVKEKVNIPVIGNGDVFSPEDFKEKLEYSGVDAIMIARGAMGNPQIFEQINDYLKKGSYEQKNGIEQLSEYLKLTKKYKIFFGGVKTRSSGFIKGIKGGAEIRRKINTCNDFKELNQIIAKTF